MFDKDTLNAVIRGHSRADGNRQSVCVPAQVTKVYGSVVDIKPLQNPVRYDENGTRDDVTQPLDYEGVQFISGFGNDEAGLYLPPKVGMVGIFIVADYEGKGEVKYAAVRQRSSGWFLPTEQYDHKKEVTIKHNGCLVVLSETGIDIKDAAGVSLIDAVKELNNIVKGCCNAASPSAEAFSK